MSVVRHCRAQDRSLIPHGEMPLGSARFSCPAHPICWTNVVARKGDTARARARADIEIRVKRQRNTADVFSSLGESLGSASLVSPRRRKTPFSRSRQLEASSRFRHRLSHRRFIFVIKTTATGETIVDFGAFHSTRGSACSILAISAEAEDHTIGAANRLV